MLEAIFSAKEEVLKRWRRNVIRDQTLESIMWTLINILYREYCLARLHEMRRITFAR